MDLSTLLAGAIHDVKNQLHLIAPDLAYLADSADPKVRQVAEKISDKVIGMDTSLVRLLVLYRLSSKAGSVPVNINEIYVADLLDSLPKFESGSRHAGFEHADENRVVYDVSCDPALIGYFDETLVSAVLRDALDNARRYAHSRVLISATEEENGTRIMIEDDGAGPRILANKGDPGLHSTGLGLHLAQCVAEAHSSKAKAGYARLEVSRELGGGAFTLFLP